MTPTNPNQESGAWGLCSSQASFLSWWVWGGGGLAGACLWVASVTSCIHSFTPTYHLPTLHSVPLTLDERSSMLSPWWFQRSFVYPLSCSLDLFCLAGSGGFSKLVGGWVSDWNSSNKQPHNLLAWEVCDVTGDSLCWKQPVPEMTCLDLRTEIVFTTAYCTAVVTESLHS